MKAASDLAGLAERLRIANLERDAGVSVHASERQPVHTVYGGAHLFRADTAMRLGDRALAAMDQHGPDDETFAGMLDVDAAQGARIALRVREKLRTEPVEDYRIDFEDGYGVRLDEEEDRDADAVAERLLEGSATNTLPPRIGFRIKALTEETRARAERTLRRVLDPLCAGGTAPDGLVVTLPKVTVPEQPAYLAALLADAEARLGIARGSLRMELMVETPEALVDARGRGALRGLVSAGGGRVVAAHLGAYDYTAALGIAASEQRLQHPACDHARAEMQLQLAGTGVWLADGATTTLPVPIHRGEELTTAQRAENLAAMRAAWRQHADDVRHGLASGFYQGWDLHPAQLVSRYAAVHVFFIRGFDPAAARLRNFLERAAQATRIGGAFDDAATGQGLLNFFRRGLACGALDAAAVESAIGVPAASLRSRSFAELGSSLMKKP